MGLHHQPRVVVGLGQEFGRPAGVVEVAPRLLATDELAYQDDPRREFDGLIGQEIEMGVRALEIAGEAQKLDQEAACILIGRLAPQDRVAGLDRLPERA